MVGHSSATDQREMKFVMKMLSTEEECRRYMVTIALGMKDEGLTWPSPGRPLPSRRR